MQYCMAFQAEFVEKTEIPEFPNNFQKFPKVVFFYFKAANAGMQYCMAFQAEFVEKF